MPSPFSSEGTRADARSIAANLGTDFLELSIEDSMRAYDELLAGPFEGREPDITEENVQARIRGNVVMALSNKFGWLVLTTGNKSEMSVGYATLYGDMAGGFAVLKDVFKGWVYRLVRWRNEQEDRPLVPESVLERPPSAELRYEQRDDESLPSYDLLDRILAGYVEQDLDAGELVTQGMPAEEVERVIRMVDRAEYSGARRRRAYGSPPRPSAATGACRSRTAGRAAPRRGPGAYAPSAERTAIVTRVRAHSLPWSSVNSISQTHVVRPRCRTVPVAWTVPSETGRRKLVWFDWPMASIPSPLTAL